MLTSDDETRHPPGISCIIEQACKSPILCDSGKGRTGDDPCPSHGLAINEGQQANRQCRIFDLTTQSSPIVSSGMSSEPLAPTGIGVLLARSVGVANPGPEIWRRRHNLDIAIDEPICHLVHVPTVQGLVVTGIVSGNNLCPLVAVLRVRATSR